MFPHNNGVRFVTVKRFAELTGYSQASVFEKSEDGTWVEDREWKWTADGRKMMDLEGYQAWCLKEGRASTRGRRKQEPQP